jgi:hypothetical protein
MDLKIYVFELKNYANCRVQIRHLCAVFQIWLTIAQFLCQLSEATLLNTRVQNKQENSFIIEFKSIINFLNFNFTPFCGCHCCLTAGKEQIQKQHF